MPVILANHTERQSFNQDDFHFTEIQTAVIDGETITTIYQGRATVSDLSAANIKRCWTIKRTTITESEDNPTTVEVAWAMENNRLKTNCFIHQASTYEYGFII